MSPASALARVPKPVRALIVLLVLTGVAAIIWRATRGLRAEPENGIVASGIIEARTIELAAEVGGTVLKRPIEKGQTVEQGQLIAVIANEVSTAQLAQAEAALEVAFENQSRADEAVRLQEGTTERDVERADAALRTAGARSRDVEDGARPQEVKAAQAAAAQAKAAMQAAEAKLAQLEAGLRPEEIRQAESGLEAAQAQVQAARAQLADLKAGARPQETEQARSQVNKARTALTKAERDYSRVTQLVAQGAMSEQQLDTATAAYEAAQADLTAAGERLALVEAGARENQIDGAQAQLEQALANQRKAEQALALARKGPRREDIDQARAAVRQARAAYDAALASLDLVRSGARRGQKDTARKQVDEARAALGLARENRRQVELRKAEAQAASAQVEQAQATVDAARAGLDKFEIFAHSGGIIDDTNVRVGEVLKPGASIATLVDFSDTWVTVYVPEPKLALVRTGQPANVTVDGLPDQVFRGTVRRIASEAEFTPKYVQTQDERARTVFAVEIAVPNSEGILKPGMPADAVIGGANSGQ